MKEYLFHWQFWAAVILVALITNWAYARFFGGKGNLV
jgi:hypothetical protein